MNLAWVEVESVLTQGPSADRKALRREKVNGNVSIISCGDLSCGDLSSLIKTTSFIDSLSVTVCTLETSYTCTTLEELARALGMSLGNLFEPRVRQDGVSSGLWRVWVNLQRSPARQPEGLVKNLHCIFLDAYKRGTQKNSVERQVSGPLDRSRSSELCELSWGILYQKKLSR